jgi:hypothetical protein
MSVCGLMACHPDTGNPMPVLYMPWPQLTQILMLTLTKISSKLFSFFFHWPNLATPAMLEFQQK